MALVMSGTDACYAIGSDSGPLAQLVEQQTLNPFTLRPESQKTPVLLAELPTEPVPPGQNTAGSTRNGWQYGWQYQGPLRTTFSPFPPSQPHSLARKLCRIPCTRHATLPRPPSTHRPKRSPRATRALSVCVLHPAPPTCACRASRRRPSSTPPPPTHPPSRHPKAERVPARDPSPAPPPSPPRAPQCPTLAPRVMRCPTPSPRRGQQHRQIPPPRPHLDAVPRPPLPGPCSSTRGRHLAAPQACYNPVQLR